VSGFGLQIDFFIRFGKISELIISYPYLGSRNDMRTSIDEKFFKKSMGIRRLEFSKQVHSKIAHVSYEEYALRPVQLDALPFSIRSPLGDSVWINVHGGASVCPSSHHWSRLHYRWNTKLRRWNDELVIKKPPCSHVVDTSQIIDAANRTRGLLCHLRILAYLPKPQTTKL
jgi:hypothetical protein